MYYSQFCCNFAALRYKNMDTNLNIELKLKIVITAFFVVMMMFFSPYKIAAQDNPYKIDNDLYNLYQKAYNAKKDKSGLTFADSLYSLAKKRNNGKAACLSLTITAAYYRSHNDVKNFEHTVEMLKNEAKNARLNTYYYYAYSILSVYYLNTHRTIKALQVIKEMGDQAYAENNHYGLYTYHKLRGNLYYVYGDYVKATECYQQAINIHHNHVEKLDCSNLYIDLAQCLDKLTRRNEAIDLIKKGLENTVNPYAKSAMYFRLCKLLFWDKKYDEYRKTFAEAEKQFNKGFDKEDVLNLRVMRALVDNDTEKALKLAEQHKTKAYKDEAMRDIYVATGQFDKAYPIYMERACEVEWAVRRHSAEYNLAEYDAWLETNELQLSKATLEYELAKQRITKAEEENEIQLQMQENMAMKLANDSNAIAKMRTDSLLRSAETEMHEAEMVRLAAENKQNKLIMYSAAIFFFIIIAYAAFVRNRNKFAIDMLEGKQAQLASALNKAQEAERVKTAFVDSFGQKVTEPMNKVLEISKSLIDAKEALNAKDKDRLCGEMTTTAESLTTMLNGLLKNALDDSVRHTAKTILLTLTLVSSFLPAFGYSIEKETRDALEKGHTLTALRMVMQEKKEASAVNDKRRLFVACRMAGNVFLQRHYYKRAQDEYEEAAALLLSGATYDIDPTSLFVNLARICRMHKEYGNARKYLDNAVAFDMRRQHKQAIGREKAKLDFETLGKDIPKELFAVMTPAERLRHEEISYVKQGKWEDACRVFQEEVVMHRRNIEDILKNDRREMSEIAGNRKLESENMRMKTASSNMLAEQVSREAELAKSLLTKQQLVTESNTLLLNKMKAEARLGNTKAARDRKVMEMHRQQTKLNRWGAITTAVLLAFVVIIIMSYFYHSNIHKKKLRAKNIELDRALKEVERSEKTKTMFIQNMSHEIRTPLNAIVGFTQLISAQGDELSEKEKMEFVNIVKNNSELLQHLVHDVTSLSELGSGQYVANLANHKLNTLCQQALDTVRHKAHPDVPLVFDTNVDDDFMICTDAHRVLEVLINFLTNAIKYTEQGSITLQCQNNDAEGKVTLAVADTGVGIPEGKHTEIFERFAKLDSFHQGTGLGLHICTVIAKMLNGEVGIDPDYKKGARFYLKLPTYRHS